MKPVNGARSGPAHGPESTDTDDGGERKARPYPRLGIWFDMLTCAARTDPRLMVRALVALSTGKRLRAWNLLLRANLKNAALYNLWILSVERPRLAKLSHSKHEPDAVARLSFGKTDAIEDDWPVLQIEADRATLARLQELHDLGVRWLIVDTPGWQQAEAAPRVLPGLLRAIGRAAFVYWDYDAIDADGQRSLPRKTPSWNRLHFLGQDFVGGACALSVAALIDVMQRSQRLPALPDLLIALAETTDAPVRLPHTLSHRSLGTTPAASRLGAVAASLGTGWIVADQEPGILVLQPRLPDPPPIVTLIVPTRDQPALLRTCIEGLRAARYPGQCEIVIIDNGSQDPIALSYLAALEQTGAARVLRDDRPFNYAALNNMAVREARGAVLCFINNDVEPVSPDWLEPLVAFAALPGMGAAGARLLYPDRTIQHAGVTIGLGNAAGHAHRHVGLDAQGYFREHCVTRTVKAVTGACLAVARDRFLQVGGFDEDNFAVAYNDVDLCLRLDALGLMNVYVPAATLYHHESKSRGRDDHPANRARYARELEALQARWNTTQVVDAYHHPDLARSSEQYVLGWP